MGYLGELQPGQLERHARSHAHGLGAKRFPIDQIFVIHIGRNSSFDCGEFEISLKGSFPLTLISLNTAGEVVAGCQRPVEEDKIPPYSPPELTLDQALPSAGPHRKWLAIGGLLLGT